MNCPLNGEVIFAHALNRENRFVSHFKQQFAAEAAGALAVFLGQAFAQGLVFL